MDTIQKEWLRKFGMSCVRSLLTIIGTYFVARGYITEGQTGAFLTDETVEQVFGLILVAIPRGWAWALANFHVYFPRKARDAAPDTSLTEIKQETFEDKKTTNFMTSA